MKQITKIRCLIPFRHFKIGPNGYCFSCCDAWSKVGNIGRLKKNNTIMDIWNSKRSQYIRKCILENKLEEVCNFTNCLFAARNEWIDLNNIDQYDENMKRIIWEVRMRKTILDTAPYTIDPAGSGVCNLKCIMCSIKNTKKDLSLDKYVYSKVLPEILPEISEIILTGFGDPLYNKNSRNFLQTLNASQYPSLTINILTNGLLFTEKIWESIKHNNYGWISVSVDACTKKTYEYIRRKGDWNLINKNLKFIKTLRTKNIFKEFIISYVVMKSNYKEMKGFAEFCYEIGCDSILYQRILGWRDVRENINFSRNFKIMNEIAIILNDKIFLKKEIDTLLIDNYRQYSNIKPGRINIFYTKTIEFIFYYFILFIYSICNRFPALYNVTTSILQFIKSIKFMIKICKVK